MYHPTNISFSFQDGPMNSPDHNYAPNNKRREELYPQNDSPLAYQGQLCFCFTVTDGMESARRTFQAGVSGRHHVIILLLSYLYFDQSTPAFSQKFWHLITLDTFRSPLLSSSSSQNQHSIMTTDRTTHHHIWRNRYYHPCSNLSNCRLLSDSSRCSSYSWTRRT